MKKPFGNSWKTNSDDGSLAQPDHSTVPGALPGYVYRFWLVGHATHTIDKRLLHGGPLPGSDCAYLRHFFQHAERVRVCRRTGTGLFNGNEFRLHGHRFHGRFHDGIFPGCQADPSDRGTARQRLPAGHCRGPLQQQSCAVFNRHRHTARGNGLSRRPNPGHGRSHAIHYQQRRLVRLNQPVVLHGGFFRGTDLLLRHGRHYRVRIYRRDSGVRHGSGRGAYRVYRLRGV